jgi:hypothetical protein
MHTQKARAYRNDSDYDDKDCGVSGYADRDYDVNCYDDSDYDDKDWGGNGY